MEKSCITDHLERTRTYILQNSKRMSKQPQRHLEILQKCPWESEKMRRGCGKEKNVIWMLKKGRCQRNNIKPGGKICYLLSYNETPLYVESSYKVLSLDYSSSKSVNLECTFLIRYLYNFL